MNRKLELKISLKEAEKEYDLCYLQIMKTLNHFRRFADMKDMAESYIRTKRIIRKRLKEYEE